MKLLRNAFALLLLLTGSQVMAQDEASKLPVDISGSVDAYYKYDFSESSQIGTSFATDHNSFSLGMANIILSKEIGKASFVADLAFGPRSKQSTSAGNGIIQNLYVAYALSEKATITGGFMGTFVGYEVISPAANFNYSTSYLFSNGPFQNAGVKLDYAISEKVGVMVGIFNDVDNDVDITGQKDFGAQLSLSPIDGLSLYINYLASPTAYSTLDLTASYDLSEKFYVGLNAAYNRNSKDGYGLDGDNGFNGVAVYANGTLSESFKLGARFENFTEIAKSETNNTNNGTAYNSFTLTGQIGKGAIKLMPELRFDNASKEVFKKADGTATKTAAQFLVAAVFAF